VQDQTQRLIAEKLINEALFMAETGKLTFTHRISSSSANNVQSTYIYSNATSQPVEFLSRNRASPEDGSTENSDTSVVSFFFSNYTDL